MNEDEFIVWSSDDDDPARAELSQARAAIAANPDLRVVRQSGADEAPRRLLVAGDEAVLRAAIEPFGAIKIEQNLKLKPLTET